MALNSTLSNFQHFPTDCPHIEKNGWTLTLALSQRILYVFCNPRQTTNNGSSAFAVRKMKSAHFRIVPTWGWGFEWW
jgi:hypothetical protein